MEIQKLSDQQLALLKEPLAPEAIKPHPTKPYLSTIKAPYVIERFNDVFGVGQWFLRDEIVERSDKGMVTGKVFFTAPLYGIELWSYGGNDNPDRGDAYKGMVTDAITKIGSYLGIGMDVFKGLSTDTPASEKQENIKTENLKGPVSEKQIAMITKLIQQKQIGLPEVILAGFPNLTPSTKQGASSLITWLLSQPSQPNGSVELTDYDVPPDLNIPF